MAGYTLLASSSTVQVLSPTVVNDVVYCTIQTIPSGVIASTPVDQLMFFQQTTNTKLEGFAGAVEEIMAMPEVIAGAGSQTIDASGLLADNVVFTVEYAQPNVPGSRVTAEAVVPVTLLFDPRVSAGGGGLAAAEAIVRGVYADLQSAAGG